MKEFAAFGGPPTFARPLHVEQCNLPSWVELEGALRGIFARRYFANGGPLVRSLDQRLADFLACPHAVCVTNETVAMMILAKALDVSGEVIVPAFAPSFLADGIAWAGLEPVECDVDREALMLTRELAARAITERTVAIVGSHVFGQSCYNEGLQTLAQDCAVPLLFDASQAFGCADRAGRLIGSFGSGEIFSLHAASILNAVEGACITTTDSELAARFRTMRNFYVPAERVPLRINGKMAEAPPAMALLGIEHFETYRQANAERYDAYRTALQDIPGLRLFPSNDGGRNNFQSIVIEVDRDAFGLTRDDLLSLTAAENAFLAKPFARSQSQLPVADRLYHTLALLPNAQDVTTGDVIALCHLLRAAARQAAAIRERLGLTP